jgi:hypothetical protein
MNVRLAEVARRRTAATNGSITDGGNGRHAADVDLAEHEAFGLVGRRLAEHEVAVPQQGQAVSSQPDLFVQQRDPVGLKPAPQALELRQVRAAGLRGSGPDERVDRLMAEATDPVFDQIGTHHAFGDPRLPRLVNHVAACLGFEVRGQTLAQRRDVYALFFAALLRMAHPQRLVATLAFDALAADAGVAAVLFQNPRAMQKPPRQIHCNLCKAFDAVHIAAEGQVASGPAHPSCPVAEWHRGAR